MADAIELIEFLKQNDVGEEVLSKLKEQAIIYVADFLELKEFDFREMDIKIGHRKQLCRLMANLEESKDTLQKTQTVNNEAISDTNSSIMEPNYIVPSATKTNVATPNVIIPSPPTSNVDSSTITTFEDLDGQIFDIVGDSIFTIKSICRYSENKDLTALLDLKAPDILKLLKSNITLDVSKLNLLNKIVVDNLVESCSYYPSTMEKENCAKSIVHNFPSLAAANMATNLPNYSVWFHSKGSRDGKKAAGKIEFRLEHLRLKLSPTQKKNIVRRKINNVVNSDSISAMESIEPIQENKASIMEMLIATLDRRNELRRKMSTAAEIISLFPKMTAFQGDMLKLEFQQLYSCEWNRDIINSVLAVETMFATFIPDDFLRFICILQFKIKKGKILEDEDGLKQSAMMLLNGVVEWRDTHEDFHFATPTLVGIGEGLQTDISWRLVIDRHVIDLPDNNFVDNFKKLFYAFYAFNLKFHKQFIKLFNFLEVFVFKMKNVNPTGATIKLHKQLTHLLNN